jgi:hypothetical protein
MQFRRECFGNFPLTIREGHGDTRPAGRQIAAHFTRLPEHSPVTEGVVDVVLEGGVGSAMPDDTTYGISMDDMKFFYNPQRNFERFGGRQMPINQDAIVQHLGFMGELVLKNPVHTFKMYDPTPGS